MYRFLYKIVLEVGKKFAYTLKKSGRGNFLPVYGFLVFKVGKSLFKKRDKHKSLVGLYKKCLYERVL